MAFQGNIIGFIKFGKKTSRIFIYNTSGCFFPNFIRPIIFSRNDKKRHKGTFLELRGKLDISLFLKSIEKLMGRTLVIIQCVLYLGKLLFSRKYEEVLKKARNTVTLKEKISRNTRNTKNLFTCY